MIFSIDLLSLQFLVRLISFAKKKYLMCRSFPGDDSSGLCLVVDRTVALRIMGAGIRLRIFSLCNACECSKVGIGGGAKRKPVLFAASTLCSFEVCYCWKRKKRFCQERSEEEMNKT